MIEHTKKTFLFLSLSFMMTGCPSGGSNGTTSANPTPTPSPTATPTPDPLVLSFSKSLIVASVGQAVPNITPSLSGTTSATFSISPALPAGLVFNSGTGQISGTPTASVRRQTYTITATAGGRSTTATLRAHIHPRGLLAAGRGNACAVISGTLMCWGKNDYGQLGDLTKTSRSTPTAVSGVVPNVTSVSTDLTITCAVSSSIAKCWGRNFFGQIGDGTTDERLVPTVVLGLPSPTSKVSVGSSHACALSVYGEVSCWGNNSTGQVGNGTASASQSPASPVDQNGTNLTDVIDISARGETTCAITFSGALRCWGANHYGQLGVGGTSPSLYARNVIVSLNPIVAVSTGGVSTCAATESNVYCWGHSEYGKLGIGEVNLEYYQYPNVIPTISGIQSISLSTSHACAVDSAGIPKCWGRNSSGAVGDASTTDRSTPVSVSSPPGTVTSNTAGSDFSCSITSSNAIYCWGSRADGRLGDGSTIGFSSTPVLIQ